MRLKIKRLSGISSSTSGMWFVNEEEIKKFMLESYLQEETVPASEGLSFVPRGVDLFIDINHREYKLILEFSDGEIALDAGSISEDTPPFGGRPLLLSGTYLGQCEAVCGN